MKNNKMTKKIFILFLILRIIKNLEKQQTARIKNYEQNNTFNNPLLENIRNHMPNTINEK